MKTIKAPFSARAPTWLEHTERRERRPRFLEVVLKRYCDWVRAAEEAPRGRFDLLDRVHSLADLIECGAVSFESSAPPADPWSLRQVALQ